MSHFAVPRTQALLLSTTSVPKNKENTTATSAVRKQPHPVLQQIPPTHQVWKKRLWNVVNSLTLSRYYWDANSSQQKGKGEDKVFSCMLSTVLAFLAFTQGLFYQEYSWCASLVHCPCLLCTVSSQVLLAPILEGKGGLRGPSVKKGLPF